MEISNAVTALAALAQETRLKVFRLLVETGPDGLPATEIAARLGVRQNLMSTHLTVLSAAGLTDVRREGRFIFHAVNPERTRALLSYLVEDCCGGHPGQCASLIETILPLERCC
jgi:DNA-binding transcriptional ArsR family regulator